jgi:tripartite-type tricarboxylate transporter receptor subunit TctC
MALNAVHVRPSCRATTVSLALAGVVAGLSAGAWAQGAYPSRPVRLIIANTPGTSVDTLARVMAVKLGEELGAQLVSDNRGGAGGIIGAEIAARSAPDGYTLLLANIAPLAINPHIYPKLGYDVMRDFAQVTLLATGTNVLVVGPSLQVKSVQELIALARAKPGIVKYGSGGSGTPAHLTAEYLRLLTGIDLLHVPYKGTGQSINDLLAGQIDMVFASPPIVSAHMRSGRLRGLAVTSLKRTPQSPELPTVAESGIPEFQMVSWWGVVVPARTPDAVIARLNAGLRRSLEFPDVVERLAALGIDPQSGTPAEMRRFMADELARYGKLARQIGLKSE